MKINLNSGTLNVNSDFFKVQGVEKTNISSELNNKSKFKKDKKNKNSEFDEILNHEIDELKKQH